MANLESNLVTLRTMIRTIYWKYFCCTKLHSSHWPILFLTKEMS